MAWSTARWGIRIALSRVMPSSRTRTNCPGRSNRPGLGKTARRSWAAGAGAREHREGIEHVDRGKHVLRPPPPRARLKQGLADPASDFGPHGGIVEILPGPVGRTPGGFHSRLRLL